MIVAEQVNDAVNQQSHKLLLFTAAMLGRLLPRLIDRNDDIAQKQAGSRRCAFEGERKHVGRVIFIPIGGVETAHFGIADESEAQLRFRPSDDFEDRLRGLA